jgi:hypothetical protein
MIGQTAIDEHLRNSKVLFDSVAWLEAHNEQLKKDILNLIRIKQLKDKGVDENDQVIGYYSAVTDMITRGRKAEGDHYTLDDTGEFFRSMYVVVLTDSIVIEANYSKMQDQEWWSTDILGLTEQNKNWYAQMVKENFIKYARKILQLNR